MKIKITHILWTSRIYLSSPVAVDAVDTEVGLLEGRPFDEEALLIQTADNPSFPPSERYTEYTQGRGRTVPETTDTGESGVRPSPVTDWSSSSVDYCGDGTNDRTTDSRGCCGISSSDVWWREMRSRMRNVMDYEGTLILMSRTIVGCSELS